MIDAKTLQEKLMKHLHDMDLSAMPMCDLYAYTDIVGKLMQMDKPDFVDSMAAIMATMGARNGYADPQEVK